MDDRRTELLTLLSVFEKAVRQEEEERSYGSYYFGSYVDDVEASRDAIVAFVFPDPTTSGDTHDR